MFDKKQDIFTYVLTNDKLIINEQDGITAVAMKLISGTGSFVGTKKIGNTPSTLIPLVVDKSVTVTSEQTKYMNNFTIDCSGGGVIEIIAR